MIHIRLKVQRHFAHPTVAVTVAIPLVTLASVGERRMDHVIVGTQLLHRHRTFGAHQLSWYPTTATQFDQITQHEAYAWRIFCVCGTLTYSVKILFYQRFTLFVYMVIGCKIKHRKNKYIRIYDLSLE